MKQKLKPETWVGIFLIAGILMIIGVILGFGNIKTSKEQTYPINIIFKDAAGLIKDSQLRLGGVTVGKVTKAPELLPSGNEVMLEASILSDVKIQEGSVFRVDMQNILGDKYIDIVPPARPTHEYIPPHATIIGPPEISFCGSVLKPPAASTSSCWFVPSCTRKFPGLVTASPLTVTTRSVRGRPLATA